MSQTRQDLATALQRAAQQLGADLSTEQVLELFAAPPRPELGDLAVPCFALARALRKAPPQIAVALLEAAQADIDAIEAIAEARAEGPYINVRLDPTVRARRVLSAALADGWGTSQQGAGRTIGIDYSSPNIAKPFGVGHLRSTAIGNALKHIFEALGYRVVGVNHLGDWGTQFGKLMAAFELWGDEEQLQQDPIMHLYDLYVRFHKAIADDAALEEQGRAWFKRLEDGDERARAYWQRFRDLSLREFNRIYERLNVSFDHYWGEAFYNEMLAPLVDELRERGLLVESEGALVVPMDELNLPPCLIVKNDGATLYATRDLAAARYRHEQLGFEQFLYVVGHEQSAHFQQVFEVLRRMGYGWAEQLHHVPFGRIQGISTRKGTLVFLEDILERGRERVGAILADRPLSDEERERIIEQVTVGAVLFYDLSRNRIKDYEFSWDLMLRGLGPNERGQTGPYLQYTHTRLGSLEAAYVERFGALPAADTVDWALLGDDAVRGLVAHIEAYPAAIEQAAAAYEPSVISRYALDLAELFNAFYSGGNRVVSDDAALSAARIALSRATRLTLAHALTLLGVPLPERM